MSIVLNVIHVIGTASIVILIAYLFVDLFKKRKVTVQTILSHIIVMILLFVILLRT